MGYFKVENFNNSFEWNLESISGFTNVIDIDFDHLLESEDDTNAVALSFDISTTFEPATITKNYYTPVYFKFKDIYDKDILYDTLRLTYKLKTISSNSYQKPEDFKYTLGIKRFGKLIREWFLPLSDSCDYNYIDLDLNPLLDTHDSFDELFISVINNPGSGSIIFGTCYLVQDFDELHNIKIALADMLHLKYKKKLTSLESNVESGKDSITVVGTTDVQKGTTIVMGENEVVEVHTIKSVDFESKDVANLKFIDEFDSDSLLYTWSAGTPIYRAVPASIAEMRDSDSIFPLFFIYSEAFVNYEEAAESGTVWTDFVRNQNGEHQVAVRKAWDSVSSNMAINVFSNVPEVALEMWRFLKSQVTNRDVLNVAGKQIQYVITGERDISPEDTEVLPNFVMDLTFYFRHNLYNRKYARFPKYDKMVVTYEIKAVEAIQ